MDKMIFHKGDICIFTKSGVRVVLEERTMSYEGWPTWFVKRMDTGKKMIATENGLRKFE